MDVLDAVRPLNRLLCDLHGPTLDLAATMSQIVPFPDEVASLPDADLLDLNVIVSADACGQPDTAWVEASARYATSVRSRHVREFYTSEFARVGASLVSPPPTDAECETGLRAVLADDNRTCFDVSVVDFRSYRAVKVVIRYDRFDPRQVFDRFAHWHDGHAPVSPTRQPTALEISTFATGRRPRTLALYSTEYECPTTPWAERRAMVEDRLAELGLTYHEPREGILFIRGCCFDAETHVLGDDVGSKVIFVGEFTLR